MAGTNTTVHTLFHSTPHLGYLREKVDTVAPDGKVTADMTHA